nr:MULTISPECIES: GDSL-type esterase/lipase family protein [unclassified Paenibacillus]
MLCVVGFAYAVNQIMFPKPVVLGNTGEVSQPAEQQPKQDTWAAKEQIRIVALGDSLTAGTGDLTGKGYVGQVRDKLEQQMIKPVFVYNNFAIPGFRTYDLLKDWDGKKEDLEKALGEADLVLLTIGGNDLFEGGADIFDTQGEEGAQGASASQAIADSSQGSDGTSPQSSQGTPDTGEGFNPAAAAQRIPEALNRLEQVFDRVSKASPGARIMYVGLYHPFLGLDPNRAGSPVIQGWNTAAFELASRHPNITVVPTYDLFELNLNKYLYSDHFHPNQEGYERIAERIVDILK